MPTHTHTHAHETPPVLDMEGLMKELPIYVRIALLSTGITPAKGPWFIWRAICALSLAGMAVYHVNRVTGGYQHTANPFTYLQIMVWAVNLYSYLFVISSGSLDKLTVSIYNIASRTHSLDFAPNAISLHFIIMLRQVIFGAVFLLILMIALGVQFWVDPKDPHHLFMIMIAIALTSAISSMLRVTMMFAMHVHATHVSKMLAASLLNTREKEMQELKEEEEEKEKEKKDDNTSKPQSEVVVVANERGVDERGVNGSWREEVVDEKRVKRSWRELNSNEATRTVNCFVQRVLELRHAMDNFARGIQWYLCPYVAGLSMALLGFVAVGLKSSPHDRGEPYGWATFFMFYMLMWMAYCAWLSGAQYALLPDFLHTREALGGGLHYLLSHHQQAPDLQAILATRKRDLFAIAGVSVTWPLVIRLLYLTVSATVFQINFN